MVEAVINQTPQEVGMDLLERSSLRIEFRAANKRVLLDLYLHKHPFCADKRRIEVFSNIENTDDGVPIPGTTTAIYTRVRAVLEDIATILNNPLLYSFRSWNKTMQQWALQDEKGKGVWNWDHTWWEYDETLLKCYKTINPRQPTFQVG